MFVSVMQRPDLLIGQKLQELGLKLQTKVLDIVEKQCALVSILDEAIVKGAVIVHIAEQGLRCVLVLKRVTVNSNKRVGSS